jgi:hypothetical protein
MAISSSAVGCAGKVGASPDGSAGFDGGAGGEASVGPSPAGAASSVNPRSSSEPWGGPLDMIELSNHASMAAERSQVNRPDTVGGRTLSTFTAGRFADGEATPTMSGRDLGGGTVSAG